MSKSDIYDSNFIKATYENLESARIILPIIFKYFTPKNIIDVFGLNNISIAIILVSHPIKAPTKGIAKYCIMLYPPDLDSIVCPFLPLLLQFQM